ncbi:hypothetical protein N4696_23475 [Escherichia coli]|uniref:hypothetical protein n=1 Tax=Escherichia coli TaxID=562 RepID=UPI0021D4BB08|nr:hypothetical protein [Escherichia coli]MCU6875772.1 hypothetical protein [Escherichia coli]
MTYFESAEGETVSKERALQELSRHCVPETDFEEFFSDMGVKEQYDAQEVLLCEPPRVSWRVFYL